MLEFLLENKYVPVLTSLAVFSGSAVFGVEEFLHPLLTNIILLISYVAIEVFNFIRKKKIGGWGRFLQTKMDVWMWVEKEYAFSAISILLLTVVPYSANIFLGTLPISLFVLTYALLLVLRVVELTRRLRSPNPFERADFEDNKV